MFRKSLTLAAFCVPLMLGSLSAQAETFVSWYSYSQETSVPSIVASFMMGARGYANYNPPSGLDWRSTLLSSCQGWTRALRGGPSLWSDGCDPSGMSKAMSVIAAQNWMTFTYSSTKQADAIDKSISALGVLRSPLVVPIFGQADHWVAAYQADAVLVGTRYSLRSVSFFDALGVPLDSGLNMFYSGRMTMSGAVWSRMYYLVVNAINPICDPNCSSDPFHNQYLVTYDPPVRGSTAAGLSRAAPFHFVPTEAPGITTSSEGMSARTAQQGVIQALRLAGLDKNAEVYSTIAASTAGTPVLVHATDPAGLPWDYYLVPMYNEAGAVSAFVHLSAQGGAFESSIVFDKPVDWQPVDPENASQRAISRLTPGERLHGGALTWSPAINDIHVKSPHLPYYKFSVLDQAGKTTGSLFVTLHGGYIIRQAERPLQ